MKIKKMFPKQPDKITVEVCFFAWWGGTPYDYSEYTRTTELKNTRYALFQYLQKQKAHIMVYKKHFFRFELQTVFLLINSDLTARGKPGINF